MLGGEDDFRQLERMVMLQTVDNLWKDHLLSMDHLKEGIGLRGYAQQNPLLVYKKEGFDMFQETIDRIKSETLSILFPDTAGRTGPYRGPAKAQGTKTSLFRQR
jgi:preprotein translocase subunit SecA